MEGEKRFLIGAGKKATYVYVGTDLGRILHRPEVSELARSYGSEIRKSSGFSEVEIVPPIPAKRLNKFGEELVNLANNLDPTPPMPSYKITKTINE